MKEHKHLGVYGLLIEDRKILLINKITGPYNKKLDLPGGTIEFTETPLETLKRELLEETGIEVEEASLFDADSIVVNWSCNGNNIKTHHVGIFYKVLNYKNNVKGKINIDSNNDDSLGASFYEIDKLNKKDLSNIVILELEKLGYQLN
jgi:ADP-ribose pyrophosphatase YjhB (NUDIX family)